MGDESVTVAVRVRPMNKREIALGTSCCIDMQSNQTILKQIDGHVAHKNDKVLFQGVPLITLFLGFRIRLLLLVDGS